MFISHSTKAMKFVEKFRRIPGETSSNLTIIQYLYQSMTQQKICGCGRLAGLLFFKKTATEIIWGFPKMVVPNNHGFLTKNDCFGGTTI